MRIPSRFSVAAACWLATLGILVAAQQPPTTRELATEIERLSKQIQAQQPAEPLPCTYVLAPATVQKVPAGGAPLAFTVTPTPNDVACSWGVTAPDAWAQPDVVTGAGLGTVTVTVAANTAAEARTTTLTVATVAVVIAQDAAPAASGATVGTAAELTAALARGGEIRLRPGRYVGIFTISKPTTLIGVDTLPNARVAAGATSTVTLATPASATTNTLDADRKRPPKGESPTLFAFADVPLTVNASDVTVRGVTILAGAVDTPTVLIGHPDNRDVTTLPDRVLFDRVELVAPPAAGGFRGFDVHARGVTITRSRVTGYWYKGRDSQAIYSCNGPGPTVIEDNYLEASGQNVLFGGGSIRTPAHHPKDVVVRGNTLFKPQSWRAIGPTVKNSFECKACDGALFEDNVIDGNWTSGQTGSPILLTPRNQYNDSPFVVVQNVIIRRNRIVNCPDGFMISSIYRDNNAPSQPTKNVTVEGNLHTGPAILSSTGAFDGDLIIRNNTGPHILHSVLNFNDDPKGMGKPRCVIQGNVWRHGRYGILSQSAGQGHPTLTYYCSSWTVSGNVIEESNGTTYYWGRWPSGSGLMLKLGELPPKLDPQTYKYLPGGAGY